MVRLRSLVREGSPRTLVLLPGYADRAESFLARAERFDPGRRWRVVVLEGRLRNERGPYWYEVDDEGPVTAELDAAVEAVRYELDELRADGSSDELVLAGFSQGGALALATLLDPATVRPPSAVGVLAGYLPTRREGAIDLDRATGLPLLVAHGEDDALIEPLRGRSAARALQRSGASVSWIPTEGGHRFDGPLLDALGGWLAALDRGETPLAPI
jgi:predicted esterase